MSSLPACPTWLRLAFQTSVVRRALGYAVVVGALLIAINHGDAILAGAVDGRRLLKMALTIVVPYMVSTASSVGAQQRLTSEPCDDPAGSAGPHFSPPRETKRGRRR